MYKKITNALVFLCCWSSLQTDNLISKLSLIYVKLFSDVFEIMCAFCLCWSTNEKLFGNSKGIFSSNWKEKYSCGLFFSANENLLTCTSIQSVHVDVVCEVPAQPTTFFLFPINMVLFPNHRLMLIHVVQHFWKYPGLGHSYHEAKYFSTLRLTNRCPNLCMISFGQTKLHAASISRMGKRRDALCLAFLSKYIYN